MANYSKHVYMKFECVKFTWQQAFCTRIHAYIYEVSMVIVGFHVVHTKSTVVIRDKAVYLLSGHSIHSHPVSVPHS